MKYSIEQYPKYVDIDSFKLNKWQILVRQNRKIYVYDDTIICSICFEELPVNEFYIKDKYTGRRSTFCRDCSLKKDGVIEVGKLRFSEKIWHKGFRRCSVCKNIKPITKFSKNKSYFGGYSSYCKKCMAKKQDEYLKNQSLYLGDFYVKQYAKRKYGLNILNKEIDKYRKEIINNRKPKYFIDEMKFYTIRDFAIYIKDKYGNPITMTEKRIHEGKTEEECKWSETKMRSIAHTKGKIKVTDTVTGGVFMFKNTRDKELHKMFSTATITHGIRTNNPTRITKLSKYKNPCIIERV